MSQTASKNDSAAVVETIVRAEVIQQFVDQILPVVDECILRIGKDGISTRAVDPANVAMVDITIEPEACESVPGGSFAAGINLQRFDDYLGGATGDDPVALAFNPETRQLNLRHTNREFNVSLIDPDSVRNEPDIPDLEFSTDVTLQATELTEAIKTVDFVTDHVIFTADESAGTLDVYGEGDTDDVTVSFDAEDFEKGSEINADTEAMFSVVYHTGKHGFLKPIPACDLRMRFNSEMPVKYNYEFADGHASVEIMCAPRIQSD